MKTIQLCTILFRIKFPTQLCRFIVFVVLSPSIHELLAEVGHKPTFAEKDIFQTAYFLKNVHGLIPDCKGQPIRYFAGHDGVCVYLTDAGPIYKLVVKDEEKIKEQAREREREKKKGKKESPEEEAGLPTRTTYMTVQWLNANPHPQIDAVRKGSGYYTLLAGKTDAELHSIVTDGYASIIYRDLYPGIDVEYTLPEQGGMKYNLIVHPGADLSVVKMQYSGPIKQLKLDNKGNLIIHTATGNMMEHTPISYTTDRQAVACTYSIQGNIVSYALLTGYDHSQTLTIDPWVTTLTVLTVRNLGTSVDYDVAGNLYVYGAGGASVYDVTNYHKVAKYDATGTNLWVFMGAVSSVSWSSVTSFAANYMSSAKVDKVTNKIYVGKAFDFSSGTQAIRLNAAGIYDNFISIANSNFQELWSFIYNCSTGSIIALGGGTNFYINMGVIDPVSGIVSTSNITQNTIDNYQDIVCGTYDAYGNLYAVFASNLSANINNSIFKANASYNGYIWSQKSGFNSFTEAYNIPLYDNSGGNNFNTLAANGSYLYYYDGYHIAAYSLNTGSMVGTATSISGYDSLWQGGIAVDACNHLYIGGIGVIKTYTFNGVNFTAGADISLGAGHTSDTLLDVRYDATTNLLYVTGSKIVGVYTATLSTSCGVVNTFTDTLQYNCSKATIRITPGAGLIHPSYSFLWQDSAGIVVRQTTPDTLLMDSFIPLHPGHYTVQVQLNVNCGGANKVDSFTVVCSGLSVSHDSSICTGQSVKVVANGLPSGGTYSWSPGGASSSTITVSPIANTVYYVTYTPIFGSALNDSVHITVVSTPAPIHINHTLCAGGSYSFGGKTILTSGIYSDTVKTAGGCDSVTVLTVTITPPLVTPISQTICHGASITFGGQTISTAGTYRDTVKNNAGCDSITVLTLSVNPPITSPISQTICHGSSITFGGQTISTAGVYRDTVKTLSGCDSIIVLTVTITPSHHRPSLLSHKPCAVGRV